MHFFHGLLKLDDDCSTFPTITINSMLQSFQRVDSQGDLKIYDPIRLESLIASQLLDYLTFNTQYMRNPDMVYVLKMEYVSKINIFGLNMMVKSGLEKIFFVM